MERSSRTPLSLWARCVCSATPSRHPGGAGPSPCHHTQAAPTFLSSNLEPSVHIVSVLPLRPLSVLAAFPVFSSTIYPEKSWCLPHLISPGPPPGPKLAMRRRLSARSEPRLSRTSPGPRRPSGRVISRRIGLARRQSSRGFAGGVSIERYSSHAVYDGSPFPSWLTTAFPLHARSVLMRKAGYPG